MPEKRAAFAFLGAFLGYFSKKRLTRARFEGIFPLGF
jgi:hypothetical protein